MTWDDSDNDLFSSSDDEATVEIQKRRLLSLQHQLSATASSCLQEWTCERSLIHQISQENNVILLIDHPAFPRCAIMRHHLNALAGRVPGYRFYSIQGNRSPFLTGKFFIKVLPTVLVFSAGGNCKDSLVGFDELGNRDDFTTEQLKKRLCV
jgi:hypothetical protein